MFEAMGVIVCSIGILPLSFRYLSHLTIMKNLNVFSLLMGCLFIFFQQIGILSSSGYNCLISYHLLTKFMQKNRLDWMYHMYMVISQHKSALDVFKYSFIRFAFCFIITSRHCYKVGISLIYYPPTHLHTHTHTHTH
jgi:hypothetical protein